MRSFLLSCAAFLGCVVVLDETDYMKQLVFKADILQECKGANPSGWYTMRMNVNKCPEISNIPDQLKRFNVMTKCKTIKVDKIYCGEGDS